MIQQALRRGWEVPQEWKQALPKILNEIANGTACARDRLRAVECLRAMDADNKNALVALEKSVRLGDGEATEKIEFMPLQF